MINLAICGINGSMGKHVYNSAIKNGFFVSCGIDKVLGSSVECPVYRSFDEIKELVEVIVDFSSPELLDQMLSFAKANKTPLVIATTGYTEEQEQKIKAYSKHIPIFKSANTSLGVNLTAKLCKLCIQVLNGFDIEIIDKHHKNKNDSPSGTSLMLLDELQSTLSEEKNPIFGRKGKGKRKQSEIGIHSIRGGSTVGIHEINFFGENESITITHTAHSKELFASGALKAVDFILTKTNGLYNMNDILK